MCRKNWPLGLYTRVCMYAQVAGPTRWHQVSQVFTRAHVIVFQLVKGAALLVRCLVPSFNKMSDKIPLQCSYASSIDANVRVSLRDSFLIMPSFIITVFGIELKVMTKCSHLSFISVKKKVNNILPAKIFGLCLSIDSVLVSYFTSKPCPCILPSKCFPSGRRLGRAGHA